MQLKMFFFFFQALIILEYLVAYGSERVIDEIREHAYQISVTFYCLSYYAATVQMIFSPAAQNLM